MALLRSKVERAPSLDIEMMVEIIGHTDTNEARIAAYVSITNSGLGSVEIGLDGQNTLFIRSVDVDGDRDLVDSLPVVEHGEIMSIVEKLTIGPSGEQLVSFVSSVKAKGLYSVVFEIPVSMARWDDVQHLGSATVWSDQKFVKVD